MALTDNLVAYWKLDGNSNDSVGSNNGSDTSITYNSGNGKINQGAGFNGSTSQIYIATAPVTGSPVSASYSIWFKATGGRQNIFSLGDTSGNGVTSELYSDGTLYYYDASNGAKGLTGTSYNDGNWHFYVVTYTAGAVKLYMDGSQIFTAGSGSLNMLSTYPPRLGQRQYNDNYQGWTGALDEFGVWSRALSGAEITSLYNSGAGLQYPFSTASTAGLLMIF